MSSKKPPARVSGSESLPGSRVKGDRLPDIEGLEHIREINSKFKRKGPSREKREKADKVAREE